MRIAPSFLYLMVGNWQAKKILEMHDIKTYENCCIVPVSKGERLTGQVDTGNAWRLQNYLVTIGSCFYHSTVRYLCIVLETLAAGYWFLLVMPNLFVPCYLLLLQYSLNLCTLSVSLLLQYDTLFAFTTDCSWLVCFESMSFRKSLAAATFISGRLKKKHLSVELLLEVPCFSATSCWLTMSFQDDELSSIYCAASVSLSF